MGETHCYGPFQNDDKESNVSAYPRAIRPVHIDHERFHKETVDYFTARRSHLKVVHTTRTRRGQIIDWIPIESQHPRGLIASPPPTFERLDTHLQHQPEWHPKAELEDCERGPSGTVPVIRKRLEALGYTKPLKQYLSKTFGSPVLDFRGANFVVPGPEGRGTHRHAGTHQRLLSFGAEGQFSCFDPYVDSSDELSLIQLALTNSDLPSKQTVEAGWEEYPDLLGDWVPHLFVYYTTNGYANDADGQGGYNMDVDGWVQYDDVIFPGTSVTHHSTIGGDQFSFSIKYQLYQENWWLSCMGRWVGYYPASLFMGNQSVFATLGDHADHVGFWGEVAAYTNPATKTDMGSGRFAEEGWKRSAYIHNMRVQTRREAGSMSDFDGTSDVQTTDSHLYDIEPHFNSGTTWGSYVYVGGPGVG
jgi:hypothetical protein